MPKWDLSTIHKENNRKGNDSFFDLTHYGDEIIVYQDDDKIKVAVKIQTGLNEFRSILLTFQTQSQMSALFSAIMKGFRK